MVSFIPSGKDSKNISTPNESLLITPIGIAVFPKVNEPSTKFDPDGVYECNVRVAAIEAEPIIARLKNAQGELLSRLKNENPKKYGRFKLADLPIVPDLDEDGNETGDMIVKAKQKAATPTRSGQIIERKIVLKDSKNNRVNVPLGGGSKVRIACDIVVNPVDSSKLVYVTLRLLAVQIIELKRSDEPDIQFEVVEGGFVGSEVDRIT